MATGTRTTAVQLTRRDFFSSSVASLAGTALVWPTIVSARVANAKAPSKRITVGCIGAK